MKNNKEIETRIESIKKKQSEYKKIYSNLDQISMLSGEGSSLLKNIDECTGEINALIWVLRDY